MELQSHPALAIVIGMIANVNKCISPRVFMFAIHFVLLVVHE